MSSSRKSSASSTRSVSSATKPKIPHHLPKLDAAKATEDKKKVSYVNDVTESDIKDDKAMQRYKIMMQQLKEISEAKNQIKDKKLSSGKLSPLIPSTSKGKKLNLVGTKVPENDHNHSVAKSNRLSPLRTNDSDSDESDDSGSDQDFRKNIKAPNELLEEFLVYVMEKKWQDAHKLCKFILMYEPNHTTAKEFLPLIESKLSESSDEEDNEDVSSGEDDEEDDDDEDDEEENSDEDSDSEDEEDDEENEDDVEEIDSGNDQNLENDLNNLILKNDQTDDDDADVLIPKIHKN